VSGKPISARPVVCAVMVVLVLRLLAWGQQVGLAGDGAFLNQTIPTMTPTPPPVTPSVTPSVTAPTSVVVPTSAQRTRTPSPVPSGTPLPATETSSPGPTQPISTATPSPTDPEVTGTPGATLPPAENATPSPETTVGLPTPGLGEASAAPPPISETPGEAAIPTGIEAPTTLPPWTPALGGTATASGSSCLWPVAGLLMVLVGALLLAWRSRQARKR